MAAHDTDNPPKLDIDWLKTAAGALAAVTTAVLLSTLGAVGTLIGAALGSVAATLGSAIYAQGLAKSKRAVLKAQETAMHKVGIAQAEVRRAGRRHDEGDDTAAEAHLDAADERLGEAKVELDDAAHEPVATLTWGERLATLPWKRIALLAAGTFLVVLLAITAFEKIAGQSVSRLVGGTDKQQSTTFGGVTGNGDDDGRDGGGKDEPDKPRPSQELSESADPSEEPSSDAPSETPTETPTQTPSQTPSATTSPTPTVPTPTLPSPTVPTPSSSP